ncbi:MAG: ribose 5-phosphate isomerase B [Raineya sp.]
MKIAIGADHAGFEYKTNIKQFLEQKGFGVQDFGTHSPDSVDYPDFAHPVAQAVENKQADWGILICGSGNGVAITANKHQDIRAALCWSVELAQLARQHNDANILCLPARFVPLEEALAMVEAFANTTFEGGRHSNRVAKITCS